MSESLVDRQAIERLKRLGGNALVTKMIDLFLEQGEARISEITKALDARDLRSIAFAAHAIRSSAGNLGATVVTSIAEQIEQLVNGGQVDQAQPLIEELQRVFDGTKRSLRE